MYLIFKVSNDLRTHVWIYLSLVLGYGSFIQGNEFRNYKKHD